MIPTREQIEEHVIGMRVGTRSEEWLRAMRDEIDRLTAELAALKPGDTDAKLREMRAWLGKTWFDDDVGEWIHDNVDTEMIAERIDEMLAQPAPIAKPAAAVPDHFPDAGKMVPDDTRWELVARLAEFVVVLLKGEVNREAVLDIVAKLRGGA